MQDKTPQNIKANIIRFSEFYHKEFTTDFFDILISLSSFTTTKQLPKKKD